MTFITSNESRNRGFCDKKAVQSAICICRFHIHRFSQPWISKYSWGEKKSRKFKKNQNLNLPHINNRLHGIFIAIAMAVDLEMPYSIQKDMHRLCVNTISFYIRNLSIHRFWYPRRVLEQIPLSYPKGQLHVLKGHRFFSIFCLLFIFGCAGSLSLWVLFSGCRGGGYWPVAAHGLLIAEPPLVVEHGLSSRHAQA